MQNMQNNMQGLKPICRIVPRLYFAYSAYICTPHFADDGISKSRYYYMLLSCFGIFYTNYLTIICLLNQLSHLQFLDYYTLLYEVPPLDYYTHYLISIIAIILFEINYFNYIYYLTIILIISILYYTHYFIW